MDSLKDIVFYKHNQISTYVNQFVNLTNIQLDNYLNLLSNSSIMLEKTYNESNQIIINDYNLIKEFITGQIQEINKINEVEKVDENNLLLDFFKNKDVYQPIGFNKLKNKADNQKQINYTKSKTINQFHLFLKYNKYLIFNNEKEKFTEINTFFEESQKYLIDKRRRMTESSGGNSNSNINGNSNGNSNNNGNSEKKNDDDSKKNEFELGYDIMEGKLSFSYKFKIKELDISNELKKIEIFDKGITIIGPLKLVLEPEVKIGFYINFEFQSTIHKQIFNTSKYLKEIKNEEEDDADDERDTKISVGVCGKGEQSMSVSIGIKEEIKPVLTLYFLAGIQGLLGSSEIGFKLEINLSKSIITIDRYIIKKSFYISLFIKMGMELNLQFYKFKFEIYIFNLKLFGIKGETHEITKKELAKLLFELNVLTNKNPAQLY